jgi:hypothetical protein
MMSRMPKPPRPWTVLPHGPLERLDEFSAIGALGAPAQLVVPHSLHRMDAHPLRARPGVLREIAARP